MKKRRQKLIILDQLKKAGFTTYRNIINLGINNPYERIRQLREIMNIGSIRVEKQSGVKFDVLYTSRRKAERYIADKNLQVVG